MGTVERSQYVWIVISKPNQDRESVSEKEKEKKYHIS